MSTLELKNYIHTSVDSIQDEAFLKVLLAMVKEHMSNEPAGSINDKTLTGEDLIKREIKADEDIKAGRVHSLEDVKKRLLKK